MFSKKTAAFLVMIVVTVTGIALFIKQSQQLISQVPPNTDLLLSSCHTVTHNKLPDSIIEHFNIASITQQGLRSKILAAKTTNDAADAYRMFFEYLGKERIAQQISDVNNGIALQAAWEVHRVPIKRLKPIMYRTDWILDPDEICRFLLFVEDRTEVNIPLWWQETIINADFFPERYTAFGIGSPPMYHPASSLHVLQGTRFNKNKILPPVDQYTLSWLYLPEGVSARKSWRNLIISDGRQSISIPLKTVESLKMSHHTQVDILLDRDKSYVAFNDSAGFGFLLACLETSTGDLLWVSEVWGAGRNMMGRGPSHNLSLVRKDNSIILFGADSFAMYIEAFDTDTGQNLYRFNTSYWYNHAEASYLP